MSLRPLEGPARRWTQENLWKHNDVQLWPDPFCVESFLELLQLVHCSSALP